MNDLMNALWLVLVVVIVGFLAVEYLLLAKRPLSRLAQRQRRAAQPMPRTSPCPECGQTYGFTRSAAGEERLGPLLINPVRDVPASTAHGVIKDGYLAVICPVCGRCDFIQQPPGLDALVRTCGRYWTRTADGWRPVV